MGYFTAVKLPSPSDFCDSSRCKKIPGLIED